MGYASTGYLLLSIVIERLNPYLADPSMDLEAYPLIDRASLVRSVIQSESWLTRIILDLSIRAGLNTEVYSILGAELVLPGLVLLHCYEWLRCLTQAKKWNSLVLLEIGSSLRRAAV